MIFMEDAVEQGPTQEGIYIAKSATRGFMQSTALRYSVYSARGRCGPWMRLHALALTRPASVGACFRWLSLPIPASHKVKEVVAAPWRLALFLFGFRREALVLTWVEYRQ